MTETSTTSLADFLLSAIAEDERVAREDFGSGSRYHTTDYVARDDDQGNCWLEVSAARVLADCEAKRRVVGIHTGTHECASEEDTCGWWQPGEPDEPECPTLRILAQPYRDREGFRAEWGMP